jgi:hypothetical protein
MGRERQKLGIVEMMGCSVIYSVDETVSFVGSSFVGSFLHEMHKPKGDVMR